MKDILQQLDDLQLSDIEKHRKKLEYAQKVFATYSPFRTAPVDLLNNYYELSKMIEAFRVKNPTMDLSVYDNAIMSMRAAVFYMENITEEYSRCEYLETMVATQSKMITSLQSELNQYHGIEEAMLNGTFSEKCKAILKKIKG